MTVRRHNGIAAPRLRDCLVVAVHPDVLGAYLDGSLIDHLRVEIEEKLRAELSGLEPEEAAVLIFLQQRLQRTGPAARGAT